MLLLYITTPTSAHKNIKWSLEITREFLGNPRVFREVSARIGNVNEVDALGMNRPDLQVILEHMPFLYITDPTLAHKNIKGSLEITREFWGNPRVFRWVWARFSMENELDPLGMWWTG